MKPPRQRPGRPAVQWPSEQPSRRRALLVGAGLGTLALAGTGLGLADVQALPAESAAARQPFNVVVQAGQPGAVVNRRLLGHNVQWVDRGDDLLQPDGSFDERLLAQVQAMGPTVLRFPGGAQSDVYHWQRGIGPQAQRGENQHFHARRMQPSTMGTAEFLALCVATGAEPILTVNVPTGTPEEAARWLHATNVVGLRDAAGRVLPRVRWWEIGNEPYLTDEARPELRMEPEDYARRTDAIIRALREVDPTIEVGLPVSNNQRNGVPVVHHRDWLARVLATLTERVDFACVHDGYMPFVQENLGSPATQRELAYWAAMASARAVQADWATLRATLARLRPGQRLPLALTEYHAIFSLGQGPRDEWTGSPAGALYVADLLRTAAQEPDLLMANLWSLSGNWRFGAVNGQGFVRPVAEVLQLMGVLLQGRLLPVATDAPTVATPAAGLAPAQAALPLLETLATTHTEAEGTTTLRVLLLHKHPRRPGPGEVRIEGAVVQQARLRQLWSAEPLRADDVAGLFERRDVMLPSATAWSLVLPPASLSLLEVQVQGAAPRSLGLAVAAGAAETAAQPDACS